MATIEISDGTNALTFTVDNGTPTVNGRISWHYTVTDANGATVIDGTDLETPAFRSSDDYALTTLLGFASAAADTYQWAMWHRRKPVDGYVFDKATAATFYTLSDEIGMTVYEREG